MDRKDQLCLDIGQKGLAYHTCAECGMLYAKGKPADEVLHKARHDEHLHGIRFPMQPRKEVQSTKLSASEIIVCTDANGCYRDKVRAQLTHAHVHTRAHHAVAVFLTPPPPHTFSLTQRETHNHRHARALSPTLSLLGMRARLHASSAHRKACHACVRVLRCVCPPAHPADKAGAGRGTGVSHPRAR